MDANVIASVQRKKREAVYENYTEQPFFFFFAKDVINISPAGYFNELSEMNYHKPMPKLYVL